MSIINISGLSFCYEGSYDPVFENVSLRLDTSWKLGLTGRNGRGKTTLLKLLAGQYSYEGTITSSARFAYFPFPVQNPAQNTRQIMDAVCPDAQDWEIERELSLLGVNPEVLDRPFETLSNGEQTKVLLAALFLNDNCFLLIDEPTNHLDMEGREKVSRYLASKSGFILVSHDRAFLDGCIDHVLAIGRSKIDLQAGSFSSWYHNKTLEDAFELAQNEKLAREASRLAGAAKRSEGWSNALEKTKLGTRNSGLRPDRGFIGHKSAKMMKRAKTIETRREKALEEKQGLLKNLEENQPVLLRPLRYPGKYLLEAQNISLSYGEKRVLSDVSLTIRSGQRIAVCGPNGCGKSTLIRLLAGLQTPDAGRLHIPSALKISYVPQDTAGLSGDLRAFIAQHALDESLFKAILRKLDFSRVQFEKPMERYSAGQKKKVLIAKSLCEEAHLYIWDEPLNYIDVLSRMQIEEVILACAPTIIMVEHDRRFIETVATDILTLG